MIIRYGKIGYVRVNSCQIELQKVNSPNETLSDCFVNVRLREWSLWDCFATTRLWKLYQFEIWILYCTSEVLSGTLFRIKTCLWINFITFVCCTSSNSVNWFTLFSHWRFYLLSLTTSGGRMEGEQCSLLYRSGHFHTWLRVIWIISTRVQTLMCTRSCSACRSHLFAVRLGRTQLGSGHKNYSWSFFGSYLWLY